MGFRLLAASAPILTFELACPALLGLEMGLISLRLAAGLARLQFETADLGQLDHHGRKR
jgi:hypothetical protein